MTSRFAIVLALAIASGSHPAHAEWRATDITQDRIGVFRGNVVHYAMIGGKPIIAGDILLDHVNEIASPKGRKARPAAPNGLGDFGGTSLWPNVAGIFTIPYVITGTDRADAKAAIVKFNGIFNGFMRFAPRKKEADYVEIFVDDYGNCDSNIGRIGGKQSMNVAGCDVPHIFHEMGHTVGLGHEHQRADRDQYVVFNAGNVFDSDEFAFDKYASSAQEIGAYDYASIMHYDAYAFSKSVLGSNPRTTLETIPLGIDIGTGVNIGQHTTYSAGDIDAIHRLYGAAPKKVTVTTNPTGLSVIVDGVVRIAPATFDWAFGSTHTVAVAPGGQTINDEPYVYGRWSDQMAASHTVTVTAGDGALARPRTAPATTVYTASFIHLIRFAPNDPSASINIIGQGTLSASPAPRSYSGLDGQFFPVRLPVTFTAKPDPGYTFLRTNLQTGVNPFTIYSDDAKQVYFAPTADPIVTIVTKPASAGVDVDGFGIFGPTRFDWAVGTKHVIGPLTDWTLSPDIQSIFLSWSDGGARSHSITATDVHRKTITATFRQRFRPHFRAEPSCAATLDLSPSSSDGFFDSEAHVKISGVPTKGWKFVGWTGDLAGRSYPTSVMMNGEKTATAIFNTIAEPFTVTGMQPAAIRAGGSNQSVVILGTGFTPTTEVLVNGEISKVTYVSSSKLQVTLTAANLSSAGNLPVGVLNAAGGCNNFDGTVLFVTSP